MLSDPDSLFLFRFQQLNWNEYLWILFTSYVLTVLFESPFTNLKKLIFSTQTKLNKVETIKNSEGIEESTGKAVNNNNNVLSSLDQQKQLKDKIL